MKEIRNKEVIIGLIIIIILGLIAIFLLFRREWTAKSQIQKPSPQIVTQEEKETEVTKEGADEVDPQTEAETSQLQETKEEIPEAVVKEEKEGIIQEKKEPIQNVLEVKPEVSKVSQGKKDGFYAVFGQENYQTFTLAERKIQDGQLKELFEYWDDYKMEAVNDLIRLERIKEISASLNDTNKFYYYGTVDSLGRPSGRGLAVYGNNTYYCGGWKEGLRSGQGMWLQVAIYDETNKELNQGLSEHMYNGEWSRDLPNGQGQEHFSFDHSVLKVEDKTVANVIGNFKDGLYHGEMYIMSVDSSGRTKDWNGICKNGVWETLLEGSLTKGVWRSTEMNADRHYDYHFMHPRENIRQGVYGMKR